MPLVLIFHYLLLNMFRMLVHSSSGACDLFWIYFMGCIALVRCVLVLRCGSAGVVWYPYAGWGTSASACIRSFLLRWFSSAEPVPSWSCSQAVSKPVWHMPLLCVQWKTPDDGQRKCPKHVELHSKNKFEKLVHLVGFVIRLYHGARSSERQICRYSQYCTYIPCTMGSHITHRVYINNSLNRNNCIY